MSQVTTFTMNLEDEYGAYPEALVAIFNDSEMSHRQRKSIDGLQNYTHSVEIAQLEYSANFWQSKAAQAVGKKSRPMINVEHGSDSRVFSVDLEHEESQRIMAGSLAPMEMADTLIKHDIKRNFKF